MSKSAKRVSRRAVLRNQTAHKLHSHFVGGAVFRRDYPRPGDFAVMTSGANSVDHSASDRVGSGSQRRRLQNQFGAGARALLGALSDCPLDDPRPRFRYWRRPCSVRLEGQQARSTRRFSSERRPCSAEVESRNHDNGLEHSTPAAERLPNWEALSEAIRGCRTHYCRRPKSLKNG